MTNDYLMRYIEDTARALGKFLMGRTDFGEHDIIEEEGSLSQGNFLRYRLRKLLAEGKVCEAEDLLFETIELDPAPLWLPAAMDFYAELAAWPEAKLAAANFSAEEVAEGLAAIRRIYEVQP